MDSRKKMIDRIRKLLAVTSERGASEGEALAAALAAQKLIAENSVEEWELAGEGEPIREIEVPARRNWLISLSGIVAENFRCRALVRWSYRGEFSKRRKKLAVFYGYESDARAAALVFEHLSKAGARVGNAYASEKYDELRSAGYRVDKRTVFDTWAAGFCRGVADELEKQSQALLIVCPPKVKESFECAYPNLRCAKCNDIYNLPEAEEVGRRCGRDAVRERRLESGGSSLLTA